MSDQAIKFVHNLRAARHITVAALAIELGITPNQYYYRLRKGETLDPDKMFEAVIALDKGGKAPSALSRAG